MSKFVFSLLLLAVGLACSDAFGVPWYPQTNKQASCKKSCLQFAQFLNLLGEKELAKPKRDPAALAKDFCMSPLYSYEEYHDCQKVKKFSKLVYVYVKAGIPKHRICRFKKICPDEKKALQKKKSVEKKNKTKYGDRKSVKQSTLCKACKIVMGTVEFGVKLFNYTEQKTIAFIESLCKLSPLTIQYKVCKVIIDEIDRVFQMILKGVAPGKICYTLGICPKNETATLEPPLTEIFGKGMLETPLIDSLPYYLNRAMEIQKGLPIVAEKYEKWSERKNEVQSNTVCTLCLTVTNLISNSIKYANATIEAIEEAVKLICNMQPEPIKGICNGFVSKIDLIVQFIEKGLTPGDICKKLGFCPKETKELSNESKQINPVQNATSVAPYCKVCDSIGKVFNREMKDYKKSAGQMRNYLTDVCTNTQNTEIQEKCLSIAPVLSIIDGIIDNTMNPSVCRKLACNKAVEMASSILSSNETTPCEICQYFVKLFMKRIKYFEDIVGKSLNEIDTLCGLIVYKEVAKQCHSAVNRTRAVFNALVKKMNAKTICTTLSFCPKMQTKEKSLEKSLYDDFLKILTSGNAPTCSICKIAIESMRETQNGEMAKKTLEETCKGMRILAGKKMCKKLLKHMDTILGDKDAKKSAEELCKGIKLCKKEVPVMQVFKGIVDGIKDMFSDW